MTVLFTGWIFPLASNFSSILLGFIGFLLVILTLAKYKNRPRNVYRQMPGPWGLPYFGNIHQLGASPHISLMKMWKKYGDIFQIHMPNTPVVVLCGQKMIKEALLRKGLIFADRPYFESFTLPANGASLSVGHFSDSWKMQKKLVTKALFSVNENELGPIETIALEEANNLVNSLLKSEGPTDPAPMVSLCISKIVHKMIFGQDEDHDSMMLPAINQMNEFFKLMPLLQARDMMPTIGSLFLDRYFQQAEVAACRISAMFKKKLDQVRTSYDGVIRCIADAYIAMSSTVPESGHTNGFTREYLFNSLDDLVGASNWTTYSIILHAIRYMAKYPNVQQKVQNELDSVLGDSSSSMDKKRFLPYTEATFAEILRHASVLPLSIPYCTTKDTVFKDFFIPKKTVVFVNLKSANYDPAIWENPDLFYPDRFMTSGGEFNKSKQDQNIGVFSAGKRKCIGEAISSKIMFIVLCTVLQKVVIRESSSCPIQWDETLKIAAEPCPFKVEMRSNM